MEVSSKTATEALSEILLYLQASNSISKLEGAEQLKFALALREQVNDTVDKIVQQAATNSKHAPEDSCLKHEDIWTNKIFPFLGMGHYAFVSPVSHNMKHLYQSFCENMENPPKVKPW